LTRLYRLEISVPYFSVAGFWSTQSHFRPELSVAEIRPQIPATFAEVNVGRDVAPGFSWSSHSSELDWILMIFVARSKCPVN
jgi:hypothetical protein